VSGCFLDMEDKQRRMYVARLLGLDPYSPGSWPVEMIDGIIAKAEVAADKAARDEVDKLARRA
jgi:hypothetical protein